MTLVNRVYPVPMISVSFETWTSRINSVARFRTRLQPARGPTEKEKGLVCKRIMVNYANAEGEQGKKILLTSPTIQ